MLNRNRRASWGGLLVLVLLACGCELTTANISSVKLTKDKAGSVEASTFAPHDIIYTKATVSNVPSPVKLTFRVVAEKVEGHPDNTPVPVENTQELPDDGWVLFTLEPPPNGWPVGKYRAEIRMLTESGTQKHQKDATFTVASQ